MNNAKRFNLACAYRILSYLNLDDHTYTHLSSRAEDGTSYYIYPFGLMFEEVTPENLIRVSLDGEVLDGTEEQYNSTGYIIHGNIYKKRSDINSVFHIHTPATVIVSACKYGLLPLSQWALHFYEKISYHDYNSLSLSNDQGTKLAEDLDDNYTLLLRNHGSITCGRTIHEAMFYTYHLEMACKAQAQIGDLENFILPDEEVCKNTVKDLLSFEKDLGMRDWRAWLRKIDSNKIFSI